MEGRWYVYNKERGSPLPSLGFGTSIFRRFALLERSHGVPFSRDLSRREWVGGCFIEPLLERGGDGAEQDLSYVRCICEYPESLRNQTNGTAFFMSTLFSQRHVSSCL